MNKSDMIRRIAEKTGSTLKDAEKSLTAVLETIEETMSKGDEVRLIGFGTFSVKKREARSGRNPQTGKAIKIPARKIPVFKPGAQLKEAVK